MQIDGAFRGLHGALCLVAALWTMAPEPRCQGSEGVASLADLGRDVTDRFVIADGLQVRVWAQTPQLFNPTNIDVDIRGRLWVTEAVNYRRFNNEKAGGLVQPRGDRVMILEDKDGDGVCDDSKVFVEDPELVAPLGIAVFGPPGGPREVYVSCSPHLFKYVDEDGDDVPDRRETFLTGFGGFDHDHGLHSLVAGPDGAFYFNCGNAGPHVVTDHAGFTLRSGSVYTGGTPFNDRNQGAMVSDDGRIWTGGLALRIRPDGSGLSVLAHNFRNSYEVAIDSYGDLWQNDNDDERQACRVTWLMQGANQGFFSADGRRSWQADQRPGQSVLTAHWHQEDPGVMPVGDVTGAGAPTGIVVYESRALGKQYEGGVFSCDAGRNQVFLYRPTLDGAGFDLQREVFLSSVLGSTEDYVWNQTGSDPDRWFRPSDVAVGLDGALFVADWYDPIVGGHAMQDKVGTGRILRIAKKGSQPGRAKMLIPDLGVLAGKRAALVSPAINVRYEGFRQLLALGKPAAGLLREFFGDNAGIFEIRAFWLLAALEALEPADITRFLLSSNSRHRILAWRVKPPSGIRGQTALWLRMARDPSPAVRREIARSLRGAPFDEARPILLALAEGVDGEDRTLLEAFGMACEGHEEALWPELVQAFGDTPTKWSRRFEAMAWRLHPPAAVAGLLTRALAPELPAAARRRAIDALGFVQEASAADAMVRIATEGPADLQPLATFWIRLLDGDEWKEFRPAARLDVGMHAAPATEEARWRSGVMKAGTKEVSVDVEGASMLWLEVSDAGDGFNCDWADWIEPTLEGPGGRTKLTELSWKSATTGWGSVQIDHDCEGGTLEVDGVPAAFGIGTHANSQIGYVLPRGRFTRFTAKVGPDDGGAKRAKSPTTIEFRVHVDASGSKARALTQRERMLAADTPPAERAKIAAALAEDPDGGIVLLDLAARGALPAELVETVGKHLFRNADLAVRALASEHFARTSEEGVRLPSVPELLRLEGDGARGRELFFGERAGCSKCHGFGGKGGDVGPELTAIRTKYGRPELLDAVLNPNGAIALGYEAWILEKSDGELLTGFLLADGDSLVLKDTQGKKLTIPRTEVVARRRSALSVMPDNLGAGLTGQELADLLAFLGSGESGQSGN